MSASTSEPHGEADAAPPLDESDSLAVATSTGRRANKGGALDHLVGVRARLSDESCRVSRLRLGYLHAVLAAVARLNDFRRTVVMRARMGTVCCIVQLDVHRALRERSSV